MQKTENLCEQIAARIEQIILSEKKGVGEKLPSEQALAVSFGVSRTVIREALKILHAKGLVEIRNGEGSFVCDLDGTVVAQSLERIMKLKNIHIIEAFEVRLPLEMMAAGLCAENITAEGIAELEQINERMEAETGHRRAELDVYFHKTIAKYSGNKMLEIMIDSLTTVLVPLVEVSLTGNSTDSKQSFHRKIIDALRSGNAAYAQDVMREHLILFERNLEAAQQQ